MPYSAPIAEMRFVLNEVVGLGRIAGLPGYDAATPDLVDAVLEEAGKLAAGVLAPINHTGDIEGSHLDNGIVRTPAGFREAYRHYVEAGWNAVPFDPDYGGQGLPWTLAFAVQEMWQSANMAFGLCPLLNQGAVELLTEHGSPEQKALYLPRLIAGEWTGTMDLTEPQAGSDLSQVRMKAVRHGDSYRLVGQKIFITWGDHDLAENIIHMALARVPDAPPGSRGISLFVVPKFLVKPDGSLGTRNDLRCTGLEHKLGIRASPTAVMVYGDDDGAVGYLVGEENRGIEYMFAMMNNARLSVGLQGVAIAERAYQQARDYARTRVQSRAVGRGSGKTAAGDDIIIHHPDVRRMLMTMRAGTEAARALTYEAAAMLDTAKRAPDPAVAEAARLRVELLTPVVKAWSTDLGCDIASLGVQIHGGMGFVEETGAAQHLRDARIAPIYEGTNGIQANDLVFRKVGRDGGTAARSFIDAVRAEAAALAALRGDDAAVIAEALVRALDALAVATTWIAAAAKGDPQAAAAASFPYLRLFGIVAGASMMARAAAAALAALASGTGDPAFNEAKLVTARFYAEHFLSEAPGLLNRVTAGSRTIMALAESQF
ncbi:MAG: acyl-CoA dehydrogenase [Azospirillum sp.]|nr:acyl-CoA dehydrogenase [Azospirillum sp.]